ncbi:MAG: AzlD domain-containing protein [Rubrobacteraceae bacterium]|nr:AzlD domain-containing protein [Rubrobacteraceae bacterium]
MGSHLRRRPGQRGHESSGTGAAGGRDLPPLALALITMLAPALLTALVVSETFGEEGHVVVDERAIGVGVAGVALALRAPMLLAVALAVVATALARAFV